MANKAMLKIQFALFLDSSWNGVYLQFEGPNTSIGVCVLESVFGRYPSALLG